MNPYFEDNSVRIYCADARHMADLPDGSVQCVVTSPPYWGLRKYSGLPDLIWGGDGKCEHQWVDETVKANPQSWSDKSGLWADGRSEESRIKTVTERAARDRGVSTYNHGFCSLCGAWQGSYGLEPTPEMYIDHTLIFLREIRRVLRKDGVVFWNIGDSYWGGGNNRGNKSPISDKQASNTGATGQCAEHQKNIGKHPILKSKDLCLIPFRVAISAQEQGWWVRSVIIWSKPNPMPESVTDRPTESHEYILMLTKSAKYYWDADAVRESYQPSSLERIKYPLTGSKQGDKSWAVNNEGWADRFSPTGRNIRSVWEFPTVGYPGAHFAVFPEKLPEFCIKASTPEVGCCSKCGAPWERILKPSKKYEEQLAKARGIGNWYMTQEGYADATQGNKSNARKGELACSADYQTLGWQPTCSCNADKVPSLVLDPFTGSGTTLWVAKKLGRRAVGYELSEEYCRLALERNRQGALL